MGVTLNPNGTLSGFSQPLTIAEGSDYNKDENGKDKAPITAANVGDAIKNLNSYVNAGWKVAKWYQVDENGDIKGDPIDASKIDKKGAKLTDSDTENNPYEKGNSYTYDDKGNITETGYDKTKPESKDKITAGEHGVQLSNVGWATQPDQAVNKDQLDQTVNKSGF